jgi:molybdate transport system ATP-binding protein
MIDVRLKKRLLTSSGPMELDIAIQLRGQELVTLFGPSGSGKTSILRMIAGFLMPDEGCVSVNGETWFDSRQGISRPVQKRRVGFVFQDQNLFPHMTVEENLRYALEDRQNQGLVEELLAMVGLLELRYQKPGVLSGGQKQRVALIRAFMRKPDIFLLDEPFASLDQSMRSKLQDDILMLMQKFNVPVLFVTHDLSEVYKLSTRILFFEQGKITRSGAPGAMFADGSLSGKFKFAGTVLEIIREDFLYIVTIQIGTNITKVVATADEITGLTVGSRVIVAAKAFNPIILKMD